MVNRLTTGADKVVKVVMFVTAIECALLCFSQKLSKCAVRTHLLKKGGVQHDCMSCRTLTLVGLKLFVRSNISTSIFRAFKVNYFCLLIVAKLFQDKSNILVFLN